MSTQGPHAVPRRLSPAILTLDSGSTGGRSPRFLTLLVRAFREWDRSRADEPARYTLATEPAEPAS